MQCHMIFNNKMEDLRCKVRLVARGQMTKSLATITYASIVSRETVTIALMIATLNDLEIKLGDILNACVKAPATEKVGTTLHHEFGKDARKTAVLLKALYCQKSAGVTFKIHLAIFKESLGYESCKADSDLWLKAERGTVLHLSVVLCGRHSLYPPQCRCHV